MTKEDRKILKKADAREAYENLTNITPEDLELFAYSEEAYAMETKNLTKRYNAFNRAKRILKIAELIREERKSNEQ